MNIEHIRRHYETREQTRRNVYKRIVDRFFDRVEVSFQTLSDEQNLNSVSYGRWMNDEPLIAITWTTDDSIRRNINAKVERETAKIQSLRIFVKAWEIDETLTEHYKTAEIANLTIIHETLLQGQLSKALECVSSWTKDDLTLQKAGDYFPPL